MKNTKEIEILRHTMKLTLYTKEEVAAQGYYTSQKSHFYHEDGTITSTNTMLTDGGLCRIRTDLALQELRVPLARNIMLPGGLDEWFIYTWLNEGEDNEKFFLLINEIWLEASSVDFDFEPYKEPQN